MNTTNPKGNSWQMGAFLSADLDQAALDVYEFRVYLHFCRRANDESRCWPSHASIAEVCQMSERKVRQVVVALTEKGFISVQNHYREDGGQSSNSYYVNGVPTASHTGGGGTTCRGGAAPHADKGIPVLGRVSRLTSSSTTSSNTTTQRASTTDASKTNALSSFGAVEEDTSSRAGNRSTKSKPHTDSLLKTPAVCTASTDNTILASKSSKATQTPELLAAGRSFEATAAAKSFQPKTVRPSDNAISPVQPSNTPTDQILHAFYQARFNEPCRCPSEARKARVYAAELDSAGFTPQQVTQATKAALAKWSTPTNVTLKAIARNITTLLEASTKSVETTSRFVRRVPEVLVQADTVTSEELQELVGLCDAMKKANALARRRR